MQIKSIACEVGFGLKKGLNRGFFAVFPLNQGNSVAVCGPPGKVFAILNEGGQPPRYRIGLDYSLAPQTCAVSPTSTIPKLMQAIPNQRAGDIGSPSTRPAAMTTPTNCAAAKTWAMLSGTRRRSSAYTIPPQPNNARPAADFQPRRPKRTRCASGTLAPSFNIRLAATVHAITATNPSKVMGCITSDALRFRSACAAACR